jgi:hypothetical protein
MHSAHGARENNRSVAVAPAWCKKAFSNRTRTELSSYLDAGRD